MPARVPGRVAVAPVAGGPGWGPDGRAGPAVALYRDGEWELTVDRPVSETVAVLAPDTAEGAREVAAVVGGVARGRSPDPFRRRPCRGG
ncbi:hypothetical protein [Nocardiopsis trehalosi]|uniref:hypothetical protein n=1 Tax=Nocardiopsis trehalosi TaxID=109329 RepID=UPI0012FB17A0|nr:hypothetical protein [Nocardiopsis trehalosi]